MNADTGTTILERQLEAFNARDFETFAATVADDVVDHDDGSGAEFTGREAFVASTTGWLKAWSDVQAEIRNIVDGGDQVVVEACWAGTHDGDLVTPGGTIPASGKAISVDAVLIATITDGVVSHMNYYFNMLPVLQQLGVMPG